ncbi:MAG: 50S ribosomal protein L11 methyltransferase [Syntrophaceae bacterium]|nr:50S ribosomal protein L11 methyltransferase [Syntrophaceae bacterium]
MTEKETGKWLKIELAAPSELREALENFLTETGVHGVFQESLAPQNDVSDFPEAVNEEILKAYLPQDGRSEKRVAALQKYINSLSEIFPDLKKPSFKTEIICDPNWGEQWKKYFMPIRVSKNIIVKPTWERYTPDSRDIVIEIDPGMAFGTGQHDSTRMCIEAIEDIIMNDRSIKEWKVLDVGCGTGILGITAAKMGAQDVICIDTDRKAVEIAGENAVINNVQAFLRTLNKNAAAIDKPRNLIIANLTSKILLTLRPHLTQLLLPDGYMIISGIIEQDAMSIEKEYCADPLTLHRMIMEKEWICYMLKKKSVNV